MPSTDEQNEDYGAQTTSRVADHRKAPRGVLPKNAQVMVIGGVSLVVILILTLVGPSRAPESTVGPVMDALQTPPRSEEEELAKRLQEELARQKEAMDALPRPTLPSGAEALPAGSALPGQQPDTIAQRLRELEFSSLFASQVALTYRKDEVYNGTQRRNPVTLASSVEAPQPSPYLTPEQLAAATIPIPSQLVASASPQATPPAPGAANPTSSSPTTADAPPQAGKEPQPRTRPASRFSAPGEGYTVYEGTIIEASLINRLDSTFAGPVLALVSTPVYSHGRQQLLIPPGTKAIGETKPVDSLGQTRMAVAFHRLILPNGESVDLDQFQGLNQLGDTGLKDKVNRHYFQIFGTSIALGFLGAVSQAQLTSPFNYAGAQFAQSAAQVLDKFLNIPPTVTIREGHRIKIFLAQDLQLPAYPVGETEY